MSKRLTSTTHPIDVHFVPGSALPAKGAIGFTLAPGRKGPGMDGMHDRDLDLDLNRLRAQHGINVVVSLVTDAEAVERTGVTSAIERRAVEARGMEFHHLPVEAGDLPADDALVALVQKLRDAVSVGRKVVVHDRAGGGRSATVVAALLIGMGHDVDDAIAKVRSVRAKAVEPMQARKLEVVAPRLAQQTSPLLQIVEDTLKGQGWNHKRQAGVTLVSTGVNLHGAPVPLFILTHEAAQRVIVFAETKINAPSGARSAVAELLHRINWSEVLGGFEMDISDGQVRYRTAIDVEGGALVPMMVRNLIMAGVVAVGQYRSAIAAVANTGAAPAEAMARPREGLN